MKCCLCAALGLAILLVPGEWVKARRQEEKMQVVERDLIVSELVNVPPTTEQPKTSRPTTTAAWKPDRNPWWPFNACPWGAKSIQARIGKPIQSALSLAKQRQEPSDLSELKWLSDKWKGCGNNSEALVRQIAHLRGSLEGTYHSHDRFRKVVKFYHSEAMATSVVPCYSDVAARVTLGRARARDMNVFVGAIARDVGGGLVSMFRIMREIVAPFANHRIIIVEDGSKDDTKNLLLDWMNEDPLRRFVHALPVIKEHEWAHRKGGTWLERKRSRTGQARRMVHNMMISTKIRSSEVGVGKPAIEPHALVMLDLDLGFTCLDPIDADMVHATIGRPEFVEGKSDMYCSQGIGRWGDSDGLTRLDHASRPVEDQGQQRALFQGESLIPFDSCFGSLALYNPIALQLCKYDEKGMDNEHVTYSKCMRDHGLRGPHVDPFMIARADSAHGPNATSKCLMCPTVETILDTTFNQSQRWNRWNREVHTDVWWANCKIWECLDEKKQAVNETRVPCHAHGAYASKCICVDMVVGSLAEEQFCDCPELVWTG